MYILKTTLSGLLVSVYFKVIISDFQQVWLKEFYKNSKKIRNISRFTKNIIMTIAKWEGVVIAESDNCVEVEGNKYFPSDSIKKEYFKAVDTTTVCGWKGTANYYDIEVGGKVNKGAAWYYADPKTAASNIKGHIAFWKGVQVQ